MITDRVLAVYDRKSPRHNWQIVGTCRLESTERAEYLAQVWRERAEKTEGWEEYQQHIGPLTYHNGQVPSTFPRNHKWEG